MVSVINFLIFQIGWFACVLGGAHQLPWLGPVVVAAAVTYHLVRAPDAQEELMLLVAAAMVGLIFDSGLVAVGWLSYPSGQVHPELAPYWIVAMWVLFATTFNVSLRWLKDRPVLAALFGAVGGPLAYYAGAKLGGVTFIEPVPGLLALAIGWAILMPALMRLAVRLNGWRQPPAPRRLLSAAE